MMEEQEMIVKFLKETNYLWPKRWSKEEGKVVEGKTISGRAIGIHIAAVFDIDVVRWAGLKEYDEASCYDAVVKFVKTKTR